MILQVN